ncbi:LuxR family transcriptional regulator [Methylobacterium sp. JK268]
MSARSLDLSREMLRAIHRAATTDHVRDQLLKTLAGLGVEHLLVATLRLRPAPPLEPTATVYINTYPDAWVRRYHARGYILQDPIVRGLDGRMAGIAWSDPGFCPADDRAARRVLDEAGEFGLRSGFTLPLPTPDGDLAVVNFVGEHLTLDPAARGTLTLVGTYALGQVLLLGGAEVEPFAEPLSPRERESLQWAAEGKSDHEIADVMGISEHGAIRHLRAVRRKLGTTSRAHAVALGLRFGLIT